MYSYIPQNFCCLPSKYAVSRLEQLMLWQQLLPPHRYNARTDTPQGYRSRIPVVQFLEYMSAENADTRDYFLCLFQSLVAASFQNTSLQERHPN